MVGQVPGSGGQRRRPGDCRIYSFVLGIRSRRQVAEDGVRVLELVVDLSQWKIICVVSGVNVTITNFIDFCRFLSIFVDFCRFLLIFVDFCQFLSIFVDFCRFLSIFVDFC
jgi:hypothetical protein